MGEQKQFRSEKARKNYQKQERNRKLAAKRKAFQAKKAEVTGRCSAWLKENRKQAITVTAAAVAVILVVWLGCKWFFGPGGSLPNFFGYVRGIEDSWVVSDLNPRTNVNRGSSNVDDTSYGKTPCYFHLATLQPLAGYTQDPGFTMSDGEVNQDQHYINDDETAAVNSVYVFGIPNKTAEKHAGDMLSVMSLSELTSEITARTIAGFDTTYVYFVFEQDEAETGDVQEAYSSLCMCIDTTEDACVLVLLNSYVVPMDEAPSEDVLLAEAENVLKNLTVY